MLYRCFPGHVLLFIYSAILRPLCHLKIPLTYDQYIEHGVFKKFLVSGNSWRWETFGMLWECKGRLANFTHTAVLPLLLGN